MTVHIPKSFMDQPGPIKDFLAMIERNESFSSFTTVSAGVSITKVTPSIGQYADGQRIYYLVDAHKRLSYFGLYSQAEKYAAVCTETALKRQGSLKPDMNYPKQLKAI